MDVTVQYSLQHLTLQGAASSAGHALSVGEHRKMSAHAPACPAVGVSFIPLAFEALGGMSEAKTTSLSRIGRILGQRLGVSPSDSIHHPFQHCSVSLWRGNSAALWLHRFSIGPLLHYEICVLFCDFVCFVLHSFFPLFFY